MTYWLPTNSSYFEHTGILGMKWHVRRFQNYDGTLTEAGKERYYKLQDRAEKARSKSEALDYHERELTNRLYKAKNAKIFKPSEKKIRKMEETLGRTKAAAAKFGNKTARAEKKLKKFNDYTNMYKDYVGIREKLKNPGKHADTTDELFTYGKMITSDFMKKWGMQKPSASYDSRKVERLLNNIFSEVDEQEREPRKKNSA